MIEITGKTCTVGPFAVGRERCGAPAVVGFEARGELFFECEAHAAPFALREARGETAPREVEPGASVRLTHGGIEKVGVVKRVGRTRAAVEIPVVRTGGRKVIEIAIAELRPVR